MPFTVSHVAAVLPLRRRGRWLDRLPVAPLVAGSMVPDLPAIVGEQWLRPRTHTLTSAVTLDVALAVVVVAVWSLGTRPAVERSVPALAVRWRPAERLALRGIGWWYAAAALGSLTHVAWDACTHSGEGPGVSVLPDVSPDAFFALQLASSALGLLVVVAWGLRWWRATSARAVGVSVDGLRLGAQAAVVVCVVALTTVMRGVAAVRSAQVSWLAPGGALGEIVFGVLQGLLVCGALAAVGHWGGLAVRRRSGRSSASPAFDVEPG